MHLFYVSASQIISSHCELFDHKYKNVVISSSKNPKKKHTYLWRKKARWDPEWCTESWLERQCEINMQLTFFVPKCANRQQN